MRRMIRAVADPRHAGRRGTRPLSASEVGKRYAPIALVTSRHVASDGLEIFGHAAALLRRRDKALVYMSHRR